MLGSVSAPIGVLASRIGWILRMSGHESWDVWLEVSSGLVVLVLKAHA
jgi:hypothetical protein